jgi:organic hydroperoxide reductase OsmC/OhrA
VKHVSLRDTQAVRERDERSEMNPSHAATIIWNRDDADFLKGRYSRAHQWTFDGGVTVPASSSPHVVPEPYSVAANVDPEEAFVASIASCHMLWFLSLAKEAKFVVDRYEDNAVGTMSTNARGRLWVETVSLSPQVSYSGERHPSVNEEDELHHAAHEACFIANSVRTKIVIRSTSYRTP